MTYLLIKGTFHIVGHSPDGDSIKFQANNPKHWDKINTDHREKFEENLEKEEGVINLRLQGIDALETHYSPTGLPTPRALYDKKSNRPDEKPAAGNHKQPVELADAATNAIVKLFGVTKMEWGHWGHTTWVKRACIEKRGKEVWLEEKYQDNLPGYIVTQDVEKNGRPISWVFAGTTRTRDGSKQTVAQLVRRVERSANYQLLRQGLVYPYFFMTLPGRLRDKLAEAAQEALKESRKMRKSRKKDAPKKPNLWLYDQTSRGVRLTTLENLTDQYETYPYLFRKILKHWHRTHLKEYWEAWGEGHAYDPDKDYEKIDLNGFFEGGNPYLFVISDQDFVRLDHILEIKRGRLKLKKYPFDIVFLS
ncbi:MAG: hypothetical protein AAF485_15310 [Chloroflexota bacterium]